MASHLPSALAPMLSKLKSLGPFDAGDEAALLSLPHQVQTVPAHRIIVRDREQVSHCWVMLSGYSVRSKTVADGARQIVSIHMRGDLVDLQNSLLGTADHDVQMLVESEAVKIPTAAIRELGRDHPRILEAMWFDTLVDGAIFREWVANVGRRDAKTRIAHLLCEFALKMEAAGLSEHTDYVLPMTQEQLADAVGLTPVHVNRMLKSLERDGLILRSSARSVTIGDWKKLAAAGDFDANYLHLDGIKPAHG